MKKTADKKQSKLIIIAAIGIGLLVLLLAGVLIERMNRLPREKDTEFENGSNIQNMELSDIQKESLYKLCKVWGYTKYHHPSVISGELNWDAELFRVMPNVLDAENGQEANTVLKDWLKQFPVKEENGSEEQAEKWKQIQEEAGKKVPDIDWIEDSAFLGEELSSYLCRMSELYISDRKNSYASFEEIGTVSFENETMYPVSDTDMGMKLLGLFRFWNMYEYYSPNVEITTEDWDDVLKESIPKVAEASDYRSYVLAVAQAVAKTGDAHITISDKEMILGQYYGQYFLPCSIKMIDGQAVIDQVKTDEKQLQPGDILLGIDGMSIRDRIEEQRQYRAVPEPDKILNQMEYLLLESEKEQAEVRILRGEEEKTLQVQTLHTIYSYKNPVKNGILENHQIGYIDPSVLKNGELEKLMKEFQNTEGIIVDLRYYPSVFIPYLMGEYIVPTQKTFAVMGFPNQAIPGAFWKQEMPVGNDGTQEERAVEPYQGKIVLLMNEESQSQSEFTIMALRQSPNAAVVGSPSIGADGNVVKLSLPGNLVMQMSGLGVYTPEGEQTQRCGLKPDIECYPTVEGIRDGRDELIEKAIEIIKS